MLAPSLVSAGTSSKVEETQGPYIQGAQQVQMPRVNRNQAVFTLERGASWPGSGSFGGGGALERAMETPESASKYDPRTSSTRHYSRTVRADWYMFPRPACTTLPKGLGTLSEAPSDFVDSEMLLTPQLKNVVSNKPCFKSQLCCFLAV